MTLKMCSIKEKFPRSNEKLGAPRRYVAPAKPHTYHRINSLGFCQDSEPLGVARSPRKGQANRSGLNYSSSVEEDGDLQLTQQLQLYKPRYRGNFILKRDRGITTNGGQVHYTMQLPLSSMSMIPALLAPVKSGAEYIASRVV